MCRVLIVAFLVLFTGLQGRAQSLTVTVPSTLPTLTVPPAGNTSNTQSMTVATSWTGWIGFIVFTANTCLYMTSPLTGTGGNTDTIAPTNVLVTPSGGSTSSIVATTACGVSGAVQISSFSNFSWTSGTNTTQVQVQITNVSNLAADKYSGTIYVIATAN